MLFNFILPIVVASIFYKLLQFLELKRRGDLLKNPGFLTFFRVGFLIPVALGLPEFRPFNVQLTELFHSKFEWFMEKGSTCICLTSFFPVKRVHFIASPEACNLLFTPEHDNISVNTSMEFNSIVDIWGPETTVLTSSTEGSNWTRHRRIASASFSKKNIMLVWNEVQDVLVKGWFVELDRKSSDGITNVEDVGKLALKVGLNAISSAAFGQKVDWENDQLVPKGHSMSFSNALAGALKGLIPKAVLPKFILKLIGNTQTCFDELELYLEEMIQARRLEAQSGVEHHDLFSRLLYASDSETNPEKKLSTDELMGNIFLFIIAGYETSARNMGFTLCMQALWPEVQEKIFEEVSKVLPDDPNEITDYQDVMSKLTYTRAAVNESLRLWPSVVVLRRKVLQDVQIPSQHIPVTASTKSDLIPHPYLMKKSDDCNIAIFALHNNPFIWGKDVEEYKPERFLGEIQKGSFLPFGGASRICIGREFAMTEMICFLAYTIKHYKLSFPSDIQFDSVLRKGESEMDRMERILQTRIPQTLVHNKIDLNFIKRNLG